MKHLASPVAALFVSTSAFALGMADYKVEVQFVNGAGNTPAKEIESLWHCTSSVNGGTKFALPAPNGETRNSYRNLRLSKDTNLGSHSVRTDSFSFSGPSGIRPATEFTLEEQCTYPDWRTETTYGTDANGNMSMSTQSVDDSKYVTSTRKCHLVGDAAKEAGQSVQIECSNPEITTDGTTSSTPKVKGWLSRRSVKVLLKTERTYQKILYSNCQGAKVAPKILRLNGGLKPRDGERDLFVDLSINGSKPFRIGTGDGSLYGDIEWCGPVAANGRMTVAITGGKKGLVFRDEYPAENTAIVGNGKSAVVQMNRRVWILDFVTPRTSAIGIELLAPATNASRAIEAPAEH